ncbi:MULTISPECIES: hypothetical protein [Atopobiaceae]|jgi:hypothetical protein|uniref:Uncharacterized protein n=1 Tax=Tractidigestivibacter scatoligenes TaxID=1299998 RepID=A0A100YUN2_TRASO|nr:MULTISPECIES: hypothetical protein [Atopobiaceae]KUH58012.1 hypothetical protein AUL39_07245 [Tractidigestivibacter scatoligenes]SFX39335.1 hypothetical protein SAMN04487823_104157 [Olsenella sp. kh2p3]
MITFLLASFFAILFAPVMLAVLAVWLVFALVVGIFRILGWAIGAGLRVFWWLFLASLVLGLIGFAPAVLVAIIAAVIACTHPTRIG